jgi:hypothetical protein
MKRTWQLLQLCIAQLEADVQAKIGDKVKGSGLNPAMANSLEAQNDYLFGDLKGTQRRSL